MNHEARSNITEASNRRLMIDMLAEGKRLKYRVYRGRRRGPYYVYLLLCGDGSYYTGYTGDLTARLARHRQGAGARYTRMRRPERLVYVEELKSRPAAMRRESQIKALTHGEKRELARKGRLEKTKSSKC